MDTDREDSAPAQARGEQDAQERAAAGQARAQAAREGRTVAPKRDAQGQVVRAEPRA